MDTSGGDDKKKMYYIIGAILLIVAVAYYMWYMGYITLPSMPSTKASGFADLGDGTVPLIGGLVGRYDQTTTPQLAPYVQQSPASAGGQMSGFTSHGRHMPGFDIHGRHKQRFAPSGSAGIAMHAPVDIY